MDKDKEWFSYNQKDYWILGYNFGLISFIFDQEEKKNFLSFFKNYAYNKEDDNFSTKEVMIDDIRFIEFGMFNRGVQMLIPEKLFNELTELLKGEEKQDEES